VKSTTGIEWRVATSDDWNEIWPILSAVVRGGDTYAFAPDIGEAEARSAWMLEGSSRAATYLATIDGDVVATAYLKANQPGLGDHVANAGWMVAPSSAGRGIGRAFAEVVIGEARRFGFAAMQFNAVVSTNVAAIGLWESMGFTIVGTVPNAFRHADRGMVPIHIMYREL
jgi:L-amino acid N-acyltransferase YncA